MSIQSLITKKVLIGGFTAAALSFSLIGLASPAQASRASRSIRGVAPASSIRILRRSQAARPAMSPTMSPTTSPTMSPTTSPMMSPTQQAPVTKPSR